jgi:ABC-2 type transport system permease protein
MNRALLKKCIGEAQWLWLACAAGLFVFCWFRVWLVSRLEMSRFESIIENFREYERFSPVPFEQLFTYTGRVAMMYSEPLVVLCVSIFAIARGSDCISGEIGRGTMEMLLAQPVSRLQVLGTHATVTLAGVFLLTLVTWVGMWVGIETTYIKEEAPPATIKVPFTSIEIPNPLAKKELVRTPLSEKIKQRDFVPALVNLFSLGVFLAGLATFASSFDRYRWRTIGLVVGFYVVQLIFKVASLASDSLSWLAYCSVFTAYEPEALVSVAINSPDETWAVLRFDAEGHFRRLGPLGYDLVLLGLGWAAYLASAVIFCKRDLPAPL